MSEGRRRYFAVADSIADENWTNDELACLVRLMARMNGRWARDKLTPEEASTIHLGPTEMMAVSGKRRVDVAAKSLRHLADIASISLRCRGDVVEITWPKFPVFQNYAGRARPQRGRSASASAEASAEAEKKNRKEAPSAPPAERAPSPSKGKATPSALIPLAPEVVGPEWGAVVDAMAAYVPSRATCRSSQKRLMTMSRVAKLFGPTAPVDAVHGYAAMHFGKPASNGFDPETTFTVETIWRPSNIAKYLDADRAAQAAGRFRPYTAEGRDSVRDTTQRVFELIKAERAAKGLH